MGGGRPVTRSFITNQREPAMPTALQRQQAEQRKQKMIPLAMVKKVSKTKQLQQSMAQNEPPSLFSKPGEDSDVPYISDNSGM